jgi:hypothetical protein
MHQEKLDFLQAWADSLKDESFVKVTLGKPATALTDVKKVVVSPVLLSERPTMRVVYSRATNDITKTMTSREAMSEASDGIGRTFLSATLFTTEADHALIYNKRGEPRLVKSKPTQIAQSSLAHDRQKSYAVDASRPYLKQLGVTLDEGRVKPSMYSKFRQICRFVEIIEGLLRSSPLQKQVAFRAIDIGSGKGYLTFALQDYLVNHLKKRCYFTGIEVRSDLVARCNDLAHGLAQFDAGYSDLKFAATAAAHLPIEPLDILIALHACDTATDDAIAHGILANAALIVTAPCCQHELAPQLERPIESLAGLMKFGLFKQRQADLVTDAARCLLMEASGYKVKVIEFVSTEHTAKNILIAGVRSKDVDRAAARRQYDNLKAVAGFATMRLETRLEKFLA